MVTISTLVSKYQSVCFEVNIQLMGARSFITRNDSRLQTPDISAFQMLSIAAEGTRLGR